MVPFKKSIFWTFFFAVYHSPHHPENDACCTHVCPDCGTYIVSEEESGRIQSLGTGENASMLSSKTPQCSHAMPKKTRYIRLTWRLQTIRLRWCSMLRPPSQNSIGEVWWSWPSYAWFFSQRGSPSDTIGRLIACKPIACKTKCLLLGSYNYTLWCASTMKSVHLQPNLVQLILADSSLQAFIFIKGGFLFGVFWDFRELCVAHLSCISPDYIALTATS